MRLMMMHRNDANTEAGNPPPMKVVEEMGAFVGGFAQAGKLLDGAGLRGSAQRTRLVFRDGRSTRKRGPYRGENELPAAMWLLKVNTLDEGLAWAERYGSILGNGELELGKVSEPWDIGLMPPPEHPPLQLLLIEKADAATEAAGRTPQQKAALTRLKHEMTEAGVLQRSTRLQPSAKATRLVFNSNELRIVDGPFVESKELIGGFAVMEFSGLEEAIDVSRKYVAILGGTQVIDLRQVEVEEA